SSPTKGDASPGADEEAVVADAAAGLTETEAARRLVLYGENALADRRVGALERLVGFFWA
ncbi:MAG: cation-transporting P-type ATPase, partial [Methylocystis sp.]